MTVVVDASAAAKAFLAEDGSPAAVDLLAGPDPLAAPALIRVEVAAAITRQARTGRLDPDIATSAYGRWESYLARGRLVLTPDAELLADAVDLAVRLKHPLQDCLYLALAVRQKCPLVTADRVFVRRAHDYYPGLRFLARPTDDEINL